MNIDVSKTIPFYVIQWKAAQAKIDEEKKYLRDKLLGKIPEHLQAWRRGWGEAVVKRLFEDRSQDYIYSDNQSSAIGFDVPTDLRKRMSELAQLWAGMVEVEVQEIGSSTSTTFRVTFRAL